MALTARSLFLYGFQVTDNNKSLDFRVVALETPRQATLRLGFYSLTSLMEEIVRAQKAVAGSFNFSYSINRTLSGGTQNRVTMTTSAGHYELLFSSGPRTATTVAPLIGFATADQTGSTTYTGSASAGTILEPDMVGYNYLSPDFKRKVSGSVNISAAGIKEAIVFQVQKFWQVQFKYEQKAKVISEWVALFDWLIKQRSFEFTPEITAPTVFYEGTLESTGADSKGLGYDMKEMLPEYPQQYDTGVMVFRQRNV